MLENERVGELHHQVAAGDRRERGAEDVSANQARRHQQDRDHHGHGRRKLAGRDGPVALRRVLAVLVRVQHVVDQIDRAGQEREQQEPGRGTPEHAPHRRREGAPLIVEGEDEACEQQQILDPLLRAHRLEQRARQRTTFTHLGGRTYHAVPTRLRVSGASLLASAPRVEHEGAARRQTARCFLQFRSRSLRLQAARDDGLPSARSDRVWSEARQQEGCGRRCGRRPWQGWRQAGRGRGWGRRAADAAGRRVAGVRGAAPLPELRGQRHHVARAARRARRAQARAAPDPVRDVREPAPLPRRQVPQVRRPSSAT